MKKEDPKLQGLCKECTHRNSCQDAKRYLEMIGCSQYKHWRKEALGKVKRMGISYKGKNRT